MASPDHNRDPCGSPGPGVMDAARDPSSKWYSKFDLAVILFGYGVLFALVLWTRARLAAMYAETGAEIRLITRAALSPFYPALILAVMVAGFAKEFLVKSPFARFLLNVALFVTGIALLLFYAYAVFSPMRTGVRLPT